MRQHSVMKLCLLAVLPLALEAREPGTTSISAYSGVGLPTSPSFFKEYFRTGIAFAGDIRFHLTESTSLAGSYTRQPFRFRTDKFSQFWMDKTGLDPVTIAGGNFACDLISINLIQYLTASDAPFGFYLTAGGEYCWSSGSELVLQAGTVEYTDALKDNQKEFGLNGGCGFEVVMNDNTSLIIEGKYHVIFTKDTAGSVQPQGASNSSFTGKTSFFAIMTGLCMSM